jgi:hypothetical protein
MTINHLHSSSDVRHHHVSHSTEYSIEINLKGCYVSGCFVPPDFWSFGHFVPPGVLSFRTFCIIIELKKYQINSVSSTVFSSFRNRGYEQ